MNEIKNDLIYDQMKEEQVLRLSEKQLHYMVYLFRNTDLYDTFPKYNNKFNNKDIDNRDLILEDKIKDLSALKASEIISDLLDEDESSLAKLIK